MNLAGNMCHDDDLHVHTSFVCVIPVPSTLPAYRMSNYMCCCVLLLQAEAALENLKKHKAGINDVLDALTRARKLAQDEFQTISAAEAA